MEFERLFKEKIELEKLVVKLTRENLELKEQIQQLPEADRLFADWILDWLEDIRLRVKVNTYDGYACQVQGHIEPYFRKKEIRLSELTSKDLEDYYKEKYLSGLSGATLKKHHSNIRMALKSAVKANIIKYNAADNADTLPTKKFIGASLSDAQLKSLLEYVALNKPVIYRPVFLAAIMGMRRSEVLGLRWSDIDLKSKVIHIQHTAVKGMNHHHTEIIFSDIPKTKTSRRTLPLPEQLCDFLKACKKQQLSFYAKYRDVYNKKYLKYVCVDSLGNYIKPNYLTGQFKKAVDSLNLKCRFHDLRHLNPTKTHLLNCTNINCISLHKTAAVHFPNRRCFYYFKTNSMN